jgi:hypothetical protein
MAADIVQGAQFAVFSAHQYQWHASHFRNHVIAHRCQLLHMRHALPAAREYPPLFLGVHFRRGVQQCRQRLRVVQRLRSRPGVVGQGSHGLRISGGAFRVG